MVSRDDSFQFSHHGMDAEAWKNYDIQEKMKEKT